MLESDTSDNTDTTIGMLKDQTNGLAAIKSAIPSVASIQSGLATSSALSDVAADAAAAKTAAQAITGYATETNATANKNAIISAMSEISVDTSNLATKAVEQWLGLEESYEAEAKGGERTNNTVIDECKVRFQDAFNGLLPTGFTMPNSVTVDNLTYTGTTNS